MKVFVLGGSGKTGFPAIKLLAQSELITKIAIAGRNLQRAENAAVEIGEKAIAVQVDGANEEELTSLIAGYDIVMNAAYNTTVLPAIRAAMRTGTHYCDVSWGDVLGPALQLASEAETAGITAIISNGISPCISNLMGVHVARQLEEVEQLQIGRADVFDFNTGREVTPQDWLENPEESLSKLLEFRPFFTWMLKEQQEKGLRMALYYRDGRWVELDPIGNGLDVPRLDDGTLTLYPFESTDDYWGMLPGDLARVSPVEFWFGHFPPQLNDVLREQVLHMLAGDIDSETAVNSFYKIVESDPHRWLTLPDDYVLISKMWVRALGRKEGRAARCSSWFTASMWNHGGYFLTSVALAAAVRKVLRGEMGERGVMTAETAFEPQSFFDEVVDLLPEPLPGGKMIDESFEWLE
jgi:saccharopine dehydrogenase-like NADP-dependent oxidoreductase